VWAPWVVLIRGRKRVYWRNECSIKEYILVLVIETKPLRKRCVRGMTVENKNEVRQFWGRTGRRALGAGRCSGPPHWT